MTDIGTLMDDALDEGALAPEDIQGAWWKLSQRERNEAFDGLTEIVVLTSGDIPLIQQHMREVLGISTEQ